jgi:hypothetical protein
VQSELASLGGDERERLGDCEDDVPPTVPDKPRTRTHKHFSSNTGPFRDFHGLNKHYEVI